MQNLTKIESAFSERAWFGGIYLITNIFDRKKTTFSQLQDLSEAEVTDYLYVQYP